MATVQVRYIVHDVEAAIAFLQAAGQTLTKRCTILIAGSRIQECFRGSRRSDRARAVTRDAME